MKILFGDSFTKEERREFMDIISKNIFKSIQSLIQSCEECQLEFDNLENIEYSQYIKKLSENSFTLFNSFHAECIQKLWKDASIQTVHKYFSEYDLLDSTK